MENGQHHKISKDQLDHRVQKERMEVMARTAQMERQLQMHRQQQVQQVR
jgi:hypothetical protein